MDRYSQLKDMSLDGLVDVVNRYPWFGLARKFLCVRMQESGGNGWGMPGYSEAAMYVPTRSRIFALLRSEGVYSDKDVDGIIVTHIHPDHFEPKTAAMLDKSIPVFVQDENDKKITEQFGYTNVSILNKDGNKFGDITFFRTEAMHGLSPERTAGNACGVVISVPDEKSLYIAGDTVWYDGVYNALEKYHPDIVVVNACAAELDGVGRLIMDADDVVKVCNAAPYATVIASHMEAVNHAMLDRKTLKKYLEKHNLQGQVLIPDDGEMMSF